MHLLEARSGGDRALFLARSGTGDERVEYLARVCGLLWPAPASVAFTRLGQGPDRSQLASGNGSRPPAPGAGDFIVLPGHGRPRLIVPADSRVATAAVRSYGEPGSALSSLRKRAVRRAMASKATGRLCRSRLRIDAPHGTQTITSHLAEVLGRDVRLSMHVSGPRANRKPVLQLLSPAGLVVAFAKVGIDPLTRRLVRDEARTLAWLGTVRLGHLKAPEVLHSGSWNGLELLVLGALPVWLRRRPLPRDRLVAAMREVAALDGLTRRPLAAAEHWQRLRDRVRSGPPGWRTEAVASALEAVGEQAGGIELCYGAWHGDWTPWNMASTVGGLLVWDWERFAPAAPLGSDALHHWLQTALQRRRRDPRAAADALIAHAGELLLPFGVSPVEARWTALLFLADLASRYLIDGQAAAGAPLGDPGWWLVPAIRGGLGA